MPGSWNALWPGSEWVNSAVVVLKYVTKCSFNFYARSVVVIGLNNNCIPKVQPTLRSVHEFRVIESYGSNSHRAGLSVCEAWGPVERCPPPFLQLSQLHIMPHTSSIG